MVAKRGADARVLKVSAEYWTPHMDEAISFQRDKKLTRLVQSEKEGHIVPTDINNPTEYRKNQNKLEQAELANQSQRQKTEEQRKNAHRSPSVNQSSRGFPNSLRVLPSSKQ